MVHSVSTTAANAQDVTEAHNILHGGGTVVWCGAGYRGVPKREKNLGREDDWQMAMRPGPRRKLEPGSDEALAERFKASARARVENPFLKVKRVFGYGKVRYRGLTKKTERPVARLRSPSQVPKPLTTRGFPLVCNLTFVSDVGLTYCLTVANTVASDNGECPFHQPST